MFFLGFRKRFPFQGFRCNLASPASKAQAVPPRVLRRNREVESLKADASRFCFSRSTHSKDSDNELLRGSLRRHSSSSFPSTKVPVDSKKPKSKTTIKVVEDSKASISSPAATAKGKSRQVVVSEDDSASNEVESEDEDEEEDSAPPPNA
ncbi:hypothetical protein C8R41DRAFT_927345 [Lentinula lateritia]|uniref:Uncharacterized protein n=1 Tax=Lentinula lateritia TaxID=40482 RepID=A0ABQ8UW61_9AGAR|nr:hypothetical protein C8R41DRAFT_927345 [Lentinula lateritia]